MDVGGSPAGPEAPVSPPAAPDGSAAVGDPALDTSGQDDMVDVEEQKPKLPSKISAPSQQDKEEHEAAGHATYRPWCPPLCCWQRTIKPTSCDNYDVRFP